MLLIYDFSQSSFNHGDSSLVAMITISILDSDPMVDVHILSLDDLVMNMDMVVDTTISSLQSLQKNYENLLSLQKISVSKLLKLLKSTRE